MKLMRKITIILALLLVSMAFVGAASATPLVESNAISITPATSLIPGQTVTSVFTIYFPSGSVSKTDSISFASPLENAKWDIKVFSGKANANSPNPTATIPTGTSTPNSPYRPNMFNFYYSGQDVTLVVSFSGTVSQSSAGSSISVVKVQCSSTQFEAYFSPEQVVNKPSDLNSKIASVKNEITTTEKRIADYTALGLETGSATSLLGQAKISIDAAVAGSSNVAAAFANVEKAEKYIIDAERALAGVGLKAAYSNIAEISTATSTLYSRGWNSEAQLLETKVLTMKLSYESLSSVYNSNGNPDVAKLDALVKDSFTTLDQAKQYLEDSKVPVFVKFLPIIIGVIVAIAAVIGIIFLIRRKNNRWDELG